jgi:hypothetical protein
MKLLLGVVLILAGASGCAQARSGPGWLLIFPPITAQGSADTNAPRHEWQNVGRYASEFDCNQAITRWRFHAQARFGPIRQGSSYDELQAVQVMSAKCVAATSSGPIGG